MFFTVILIVCETLILKAGSSWYADQLYTVSVTAACTAIVYMRWKGFGIIPALTGALVICTVMGADPGQYLIYCAGNLLSAVALIFIKWPGAEYIRKNAFLRVGFGVLTVLLMQGGRALTALMLGHGAAECISFFSTDALTILFTGLIMWIAGRLDGICEDQISYLKRINTEETINERKS